jgi:LysM repeat protein
VRPGLRRPADGDHRGTWGGRRIVASYQRTSGKEWWVAVRKPWFPMDNLTERLRRGGARVGLVLLLAGLVESADAHPRYRVRWGDTLTGIASRQGTTVAALARLNGLDPSNILPSGVTLRLPAAGGAGSRSHLVRRSETLSGLADAYGTTVTAFVEANGLASANLIFTGTHLRIPAFSAGRALPGAGPPTSGEVASAIDYWSRYYGVDSRLARALAWMESGYQTQIVSRAGAWGVMQVTPSAWAFVEDVLIGARVPHTPAGNIRTGVAYLGHLLAEFDGDERLALGAYYQGLQGVETQGLLPETRRYVADVLALRAEPRLAPAPGLSLRARGRRPGWP